MLLWAVLALMTGGAVLALIGPLARAAHDPRLDASSDDRAFYKAQLADVERDLARGLLGPAEAEAARAEAGRRLLRAAAAGPSMQASAMVGRQWRRRAAALASIVTVPSLALVFYASLGSPNLPSAPAATRQSADPATMGLSDAIARVEAHLAANPNDGAGYEVLAPVYLRAGRAEDAARAFRQAVAILGESPQRLVDLGEAVFMQANGVVTGEARQVFERARSLDPASPKARYYLALALEQDGEPEAARSALQAIIDDSPDNAPWLPILRARIARLGGPAPVESEATTEAGAAPAIQAMVQSLATRLADKGGSPEEWARLIRSYLVLGRREEARTAAQSARAAFPPGSDGRAALDRLAGDLDVGQ